MPLTNFAVSRLMPPLRIDGCTYESEISRSIGRFVSEPKAIGSRRTARMRIDCASRNIWPGTRATSFR